jgi:hypothetical protein
MPGFDQLVQIVVDHRGRIDPGRQSDFTDSRGKAMRIEIAFHVAQNIALAFG